MKYPSQSIIHKFLRANEAYANQDDYTYDLMSNSIVWKDETLGIDLPVQLLNFMREIWAYRAGLLRGERADKYHGSWEYLKTTYPNWIGFREGRVSPSKKMTLFMDQQSKMALFEFDDCFD